MDSQDDPNQHVSFDDEGDGSWLEAEPQFEVEGDTMLMEPPMKRRRIWGKRITP